MAIFRELAAGEAPPLAKRCPACRRLLELRAFWRQAGRQDGRGDYCAACLLAERRSDVPRGNSGAE